MVLTIVIQYIFLTPFNKYLLNAYYAVTGPGDNIGKEKQTWLLPLWKFIVSLEKLITSVTKITTAVRATKK